MSAFLFGEIPSIIRCNSLPEVLVCLFMRFVFICEVLRCSVLRENRDNHHGYLRLSDECYKCLGFLFLRSR